MLRGQIAFRNRDEARKPRFGREQIVEIGVEISVRAAIADGKKLAVRIEQEFEIHLLEHRLGAFVDRLEAVDKQ